MRVGFVGLGAMGVPMACRLRQAGHSVVGFDLRVAATAPLVAAGGRAAASAAEAARDAELLWLMVVSGEQAEAVLFDAGAAAALPPGAIVVAACTQAPAMARRLAERLAAIGIAMLDAPVSGGVSGADAGSLTVMCAGDEGVIERARPVMQAVGRRIFDVGREAGMGSSAKMINQLLCGVHIAAAAEALHVAERAGLALPTVHEIIGCCAGNSWMWGDRGPRMLMDDPPVASAVDIFVKDLGIVLDQGRQQRQGLPLAAAAMQMFLAASGLGLGRADDSQVIRAYRAMNGKAGDGLPSSDRPAMASRPVHDVAKTVLREKARLIRLETLRMTDICGSGHYGSSFSMAEIVAVLYYRFMHLRPDDAQWADRDRFTMGKGHAAIGLFPVLADLGFFPQSWLDSYTRFRSPLGDHPDMKKVPGVDFSSGSIGHNLSVSVGIALGTRRRGSPARTVCLMGDGEQTEGQVWEAAISAAHWKLDQLVGIVDINGAGSDGDPQQTMRTEPLRAKWEAFGWRTLVLEDGHDLDAVSGALDAALNHPDGRPTCILAYTVSGKGVSFMEGGWEWHLGFLGPKDLERAYREVMEGTVG